MKPKLLFFSIVAAFCLFSCGKSSTPAPDNGGSTGGGGGGTETDPNKGVTIGNTTTYKNYVVKTVGISTIRMATDANEKITAAEFIGGGNHIVVKTGNANNMSFINTNNFEPNVGPYDNVNHVFNGGWSNANYPVAQGGSIDNGKMLDTANSITIKLKGFDKSKTGYNQLNLVLCGAPFLNTAKDWTQYNLIYIYHDGSYPDAVRKNALYARLLTTPVTVRSVELAKPLSENPYIVKDVVISTLLTVTDKQNKTTRMEFSTGLYGLLKIGNDISGDKKVGNTLTTELVNGDKGQLSYSPQNDGFGTLYQPIFSNMLPSSFAAMPEAADSLSKVFVRVSGFDASKCGYNQLRFYLMLDPYDIKQGFDPRPIFNVNLEHDKKQSLADLKAMIKTSGLYCYQLVNY
ncbi:hypothetical protein SAMN05192574_11431 [Mucilaginibacter gossypiicola]|uniref:Uncharacterized protein n=1 Tax=Mucilaginibacter gossypiicola TaxID=551995 RepID=A0A1H8T0A4_9SPHI|nr:hypothetical protein [Mucilaginibacter gossypiicola]SEO84048.1 hypothetical protein SAMN05192574_11431 [Mucilaginibacter gossypiicola]